MFTPPRLPKRAPLFGFGVCYPSPGIVERIARDWDWLWIDGQHGELGYQDILALVRAGDLIGRPAFVRVPSHDYGEIGRVLDIGAAGVVVPCVDTAEQAGEIVQAAKFPPLGNRSYGSRRIVDLNGRTFSDTANADVLLLVQIETPLALANVDAIARVPGVDALFLGPDDLLMRRGISMAAPRTPEMLGPDLQAVVRACRAHGKLAVTVGANPEIAAFAVECGYDLIAGGSDVGFLDAGSKNASAALKKLLAARTSPAQPNHAAGVAGEKPAPITRTSGS